MNFAGLRIAEAFAPDERAIVYRGDRRRLLREIPGGTARLVVTSPPYNLGKEYERRLHLGDYVSQQSEIIGECVRVLTDTGSICWQVGNYVEAGAIIRLDALVFPVFGELGFRSGDRETWWN